MGDQSALIPHFIVIDPHFSIFSSLIDLPDFWLENLKLALV